ERGSELLLVLDSDREHRGERLHGFDPERKRHTGWRCLVTEWVHEPEPGIRVGHVLLDPTVPILVLAHQHLLQAGAGKSIALTEKRDERTDREIPEPDDRVDGTVERVDDHLGLREDLGE